MIVFVEACALTVITPIAADMSRSGSFSTIRQPDHSSLIAAGGSSMIRGSRAAARGYQGRIFI